MDFIIYCKLGDYIFNFYSSWSFNKINESINIYKSNNKSIDMKDKDDTTVRPWLVYWLLIAILYATSPLLNSIFGYIIPFYHCFKLGFIYWL